MSEYNRKYRELDDSVKQKISRSSKGKTKSFEWRRQISIALQNYWRGVKSKDEVMSMQEYLTGKPEQKNNDVKPSNTNEQ